MQVESRVGLAGGGMFLMSGLDRMFSNALPVFSAILILAQIAVAGFTAFYLWRKTKQLSKSPTPPKDEISPTE